MSASLALQKAIVAALLADTILTGIVGARVFDRVEPGTATPYVHLRQFQEVAEDNDCADAWEVFVDLDVWSNAVGKPEASRAASAIRDALHNEDLTLDEPFALVSIRHQDTQIGDGGDGLLTRARLTFRALIERI